MGREFGNRFRASCQALIPDHCGSQSKKSRPPCNDLGSVGNRKRPMRNASTFLLIPDPLRCLEFKRSFHPVGIWDQVESVLYESELT